jgi:hypothetical protein
VRSLNSTEELLKDSTLTHKRSDLTTHVSQTAAVSENGRMVTGTSDSGTEVPQGLERTLQERQLTPFRRQAKYSLYWRLIRSTPSKTSLRLAYLTYIKFVDSELSLWFRADRRNLGGNKGQTFRRTNIAQQKRNGVLRRFRGSLGSI